MEELSKRGRRQFIGTVPCYRGGERLDFKPEYVIVEDSNSGYQFYRDLWIEFEVISAGGNTNTCKLAKNMFESGKDNILIIADAAAYGVCIDEAIRLKRWAKRQGLHLCIYLPESFEYLILKSELCRQFKIEDELEHTCNHCETSKHFSWEDYYTSLLVELTKGTIMHYKKSVLNNYYTGRNASKINKVIESDL